MRHDLVEQLVNSYPFLKNQSIGVGDGWYHILDDLCKELLAFVPPEFKVTQVKTKFGGLRFYFKPFDIDEIDEPARKLIAKTESLSYETCEECGAPAMLDTTRFWAKTLCELHRNH